MTNLITIKTETHSYIQTQDKLWQDTGVRFVIPKCKFAIIVVGTEWKSGKPFGLAITTDYDFIDPTGENLKYAIASNSSSDETEPVYDVIGILNDPNNTTYRILMKRDMSSSESPFYIRAYMFQ